MSALRRLANRIMSVERGGNTHVGTRPPGLYQSPGAGGSEDDHNAFSDKESIATEATALTLGGGGRARAKGC